MAQWEKLQQLDNLHLQRVDELYSHEEFPMDVRHYLAPWIESQDWHKAAQDQSAASILFQSLLENLDTQHSRFVQEGECFLKQRNIRRFKQSFQKYQEQPWILAGIVWWFLSKEQEILQAAELAEQVQMLQVQQSPVDSDSQRNLQGRITELKRKVQRRETTLEQLV
ncbi:hypothetical protein JZ751_018189 [Albula glossodonta]|uniref:STAT transcription factor protein interaction domain-containing protein n=1 Tax=Albula glossodonta TaxID=121402 RepID=A0A8T2PQA4_9TELE|nr:hypothetical protein JZ751_018189 [Albula glossodonta]